MDPLRAFLFRKDPEEAHRWAVERAAWASGHPWLLGLLAARTLDDASTRRRAFGLSFPNPVGLAAGFDKNGVAVPAMAALGFGFVEVGTVTPEPQEGNPRPRMFRHPDRRALVNRLGFPNVGMDRVRENLAGVDVDVPVGVNVGPNRDTPLDEAQGDVAACLRTLWDAGDYFVVNTSSPNTPGLRDLEQADRFAALMRDVLDVRDDLGRKPLLAKASPDLAEADLRAVGEAILDLGLDGIVATNTTADRSVLPGAEEGGISGEPLQGKSRAALSVLGDVLQGEVPIVSCGGVLDGGEARARLAGGASLVQTYTALVYRGPYAADRILRELVEAGGVPEGTG